MEWQVEFSAGLRLQDGRVDMRVAAWGCSDSVLDLSALFLEGRAKWKFVSPLFLGVKRDFLPLTFLFSWGWEEKGGVGYFSQRPFEGAEPVV